ncbi:MAG: PAS domain S-box protein [bacterium]
MLKSVENRFDKLLDMTSAKRLWLGFGALIALLVIMGLIIGLRIGLLEKTLMELTVVKEPLHAVSYKLGVNLMENGIAVLQYLGSGDPLEQARLSKTHEEFDRLIRQYDELTDSPEAKKRISMLTSNENESYTLGILLMDRSDSLRMQSTKIARSFDEMNRLLDQGLASKIDRVRPDWFTKLEEAAVMEKNVAKLGAAVMHYRRTAEEKYAVEQAARATDFEESLKRFRSLRLTGAEKYWATEIDNAFRTLALNVDENLARDAHQARDLARFIALRREIEAIYDEIRIPTETGLLIAKESTHQSLETLFVTLMILIAGGVIVGTGSAMALTTAITRTERSLRDQREEFRVTLASIGDGVVVTDSEGRVMFLNDIAESLTGWTSAAALGTDLAEIFRIVDDTTRLPLSGFTEPTALLRSVDGSSLSRAAILLQGGKETAIEYSASAISDGDGDIQGIVVVVREMTQRKQAEDAIKLSESRYRSLVTAVSEIVWTADLDGSFESPQASWQAVTAQSWEEAKGFGWTSAIHPDDREAFRDAWLATVSAKRPFEAESRIWHAGSSKYRHFRVRATPVFRENGELREWIGMCADITERWRAEAALRESEERFRLMADAAPVLICVADTRKLGTYFNQVWLDFTGRTIADELGLGWAEGVHPDDLDHCLRTYGNAFDRREPFRMEYRLRRADGEFRWVLSHGVPRFDSGGAFGGYIASCIDITERRRAEETLKDDDRRKDEFLAILGHELRNPLATIHNALQIVNQRPANPRDIDEARGMMDRQVQVLKQLVDDLLEVSRVTHGKIELHRKKINVADAVANAVEATRALVASNRHTLFVTLPSEPVFLDADPIRLEQSLTNLLTNAAKYTPAEGRIRLIVTREGNEAVISVIDTGIGIAPEVLPRIFESFQQVHPSDSPSAGLGIGLTLSRRLVELHGGRMEARSAGIGGGSEFVVRLPAAEALAPSDERRGAAPGPAEREMPSAGRAVLIVEDNVDGAASLSMLLRSMGHTVTVAHDGPTAIELTKLATFDVVLLDIGLPKMSGHEVASALRQRAETAETVLVAMTGYGQERDKRRAHESGFDHFLTKPVDLAMLGRILANPKHARLAPDA